VPGTRHASFSPAAAEQVSSRKESDVFRVGRRALGQPHGVGEAVALVAQLALAVGDMVVSKRTKVAQGGLRFEFTGSGTERGARVVFRRLDGQGGFFKVGGVGPSLPEIHALDSDSPLLAA